MPTIQIVRGPGAGSLLEVAAGETLHIGRAAGPEPAEPGVRTLTLDDRKASRLHCRVREEAGGWILEDLGSSNGTSVAGRRIDRHELSPGDRIRVGDSILEWLEPERLAGPAPAPEPPAGVAAVEAVEESTEPRPSRAGTGPRWGIAAVLAASVAVAAFLLSRGPAPAPDDAPSARAKPPSSAASTSAPDVAERSGTALAPPTLPDAPPPKVPVPGAAPEPPRDFIDPAAEVASLLGRRDYKGALRFLDDFARDRAGADVAGDRRRTLAAAREELERVRGEVDRLVAAGDTDGARELGLDLLVRLPESLFDEASRMLRGVADSEAVRMEAARDAAEAPEKELEARVEAAARLAAETLADAGATDEALEAVRARIAELCRPGGGGRALPRRRGELREAYLEATLRVLRSRRRASAFRAGRVEWKGGGEEVVLAYEFENDDELRDFHVLEGAKAELRRERKAIVLAGECRLFEGEPFRDRILVRASIPASGYAPEAPSIGIALFTTRIDRLTSASGRPRSLLAPGGARPGGPPAENLVYLLGYHAVVAEYGGRGVEELTVEGVPEPVALPAHVLLGVARGSLLHSDPREGMWASPHSRALRGALKVEAGFAGGSVSWTLGGKPVFGGPAPAFQRLEGDSPRVGTVTLLAPRGPVRWDRIEIEATVREEWLYAGVRKEALAEVEKVFPR